VVLLLGGILTYLGVLSVILAWRAIGNLERGRTALVQARDEVASGSFTQAASSFEAARYEFDAAHVATDNPFVAFMASIPLIGRTPDAIRTAAEAGLLVTDAGEGLSSAIEHLQRGLEAKSPPGDRIPVGVLERFQPALVDALSKVEDADRLARDVATTFIPRPIADAGEQLRSAVHGALSSLISTDAILRALPTFTGVEGPRRYFLAPQDPADLRGTGGAISYWAILKIDHGRISLQPFHYIDELPNPDRGEWSSDALEAAYGSVNAAGDWHFANAPADGPTAARFMSQLWESTGKEPIDGVIMIDVLALRSMLEATGPVEVPGLPFPLTSSNAVSFLTNGAYLMPGGQRVKRDYVGIAGLTIFEGFLAEATGYAAFRALVDATTGGHILLNATDPSLENDLRAAGVTGGIAPDPGEDLFAVTVNNLAGNRLDYYVRRTVAYDVTLLPEGRGRARATVTFENDSPRDPGTRALTALLLARAGPADLALGETYEQATVTCSADCRLTESSMDGTALPMTGHTVGGLQTFTGLVRVPPQGASTLRMTFDLEDVWRGDGWRGTYTLSLPSQPVIQRTVGTVTIHAPAGMTIASSDRSVSTWRGSMSEALTFTTQFQRRGTDPRQVILYLIFPLIVGLLIVVGIVRRNRSKRRAAMRRSSRPRSPFLT
jgi:uncharacterized protein DUF4012